MSRHLAVDSNTLTYLLDAVQPGYDPQCDASGLGPEKTAMVRLFLFAECLFWVSPTVKAEYRQIPGTAWREAHERWASLLLHDQDLDVSKAALEARARELLVFHPSRNDCRVVAEAEHAGCSELLSCDEAMLSRLAGAADLRIMRPSELFDELGIGPGAEPRVLPAASNPLLLESWWRL